ncbi:MAG: hypothetical protein CMJ88_05370 [Planctomycetes bacterium]|nr:hypothetical protein [Planctomycetota bacterium]
MPVRSASSIEHRSEKDEISHRVGGMVEVPGGRAAKFFVGDIVLRYRLPRKHDMDQIPAVLEHRDSEIVRDVDADRLQGGDRFFHQPPAKLRIRLARRDQFSQLDRRIAHAIAPYDEFANASASPGSVMIELIELARVVEITGRGVLRWMSIVPVPIRFGRANQRAP